MPPPGSPPQHTAGTNHTEIAEPYYSNEDVAILHDIVVLAQEILPKLPERERLPTNALFGAYYDILPRAGVSTDHDNRYARILFKIGGQRGPATLYEKFEAVLLRLGIEIEFDEDEGDSQQETQDGRERTTTTKRSLPIEDKNARQKQRRNSESSAWDLGIDFRSQNTTRRNSFSTIGKDHSHVIVDKEIFQRSQPVSLAAQADNTQPSTSEIEDTDDNVGAWLSSQSQQPRRGRGRSVSSHGSFRIRRRSTSRGREGHHPPATTTPSVPASEYDLTNSEITAATSAFGEEHVPNWTEEVAHRPAPRLEDLLSIKASLLFRRRLQTLAKQQLRTWRDRARELRQDNRGLELIAVNHDRKALTRSAFDLWRLQCLEKRKAKETDSFFEALEQQAWDAGLQCRLNTTFHYWLDLTNHHVDKTAAAKRHVVMTRVFNAWKEITAINELKVRRQVLKKFFSIWKRKLASSDDNAAFAVQKYEGDLVGKIYRQWLHRVWEIKAATWWAEATKRRALFRWIFVSHTNWENRRSAEENRLLDVAWKAWKIWKTKTDDQLRRAQAADAHYQNKLIRTHLVKWRKETKIVPATITVQSKADVGTLRAAFEIWQYRTRQQREAAALDRMKILREALTIWRYNVRVAMLSNRIDRRLISQVFASMFLQNTAVLYRREQQQRQRRATFEFWKQRMKAARQHRWEQEDLARSLIIRKTQNDVLNTWAFRTESRQRLETTAAEYRKPRLLKPLVAKWSEQAQHLEELDKRSKDANYYLVLSNAIKRWKASTEHSRRERRKAAFAQVKKTVKVNLVKGVFQVWRDKARHTLSLQSQAAEMSTNKTVILGMELFDRWRARAEELAELDNLWRENVLKKHFTIWQNRSNALQALETEALLTYQEQRESRAVKHWSLLALKVKGQNNYAADIREKNAKKNFRKIFWYWRQKTLQKRPAKRVVFAESSQAGTTARVEAWSDFGEEVEMDEWAKGLDETGAVSTPVPGYLATPSKRSERVMAAAARFSTTPKAPLSTPFERRLRQQWSGGAPSARKPLARSTLGIDRGFTDIPESSTNNE